MFKKIIAVILALSLCIVLGACGEKKEKIVEPGKKVAVLVAPQSEYPEDYMAAVALQEKYPETVVVREYSDSRVLQSGDGPIITMSQELAQDDSIGAIVYARATRFTQYAIIKAKTLNPGIFTIAIEPEDSIDAVAEAADLVICCDWAAAAKDIISTAKKMGAKTFAYFTIERLLSNPLYENAKNCFENECKAADISFVADKGYDPQDGNINGGGDEKAADVVSQRINYLEINSKITAPDVALFSMDCSVRETLASVAEEKGMIYFCPEFPSVFSGIGNVLSVAMPEKLSEIKTYTSAVSKAVKASEGTGRYAYYNFNLMETFINAAVVTAFDFINGTTTKDNLAERTGMRLSDMADNKKFESSAYLSYENVVCGYCADSISQY